MLPIVAEIIARAEITPNELAIAHQGDSFTYSELAIKIGNNVSLLRDRGVKRGDRVILAASSTPDFVSAYFATHAIGAIAVPIDPQINDDHLKYVIQEVEPALVLANQSLGDHQAEVEDTYMSAHDQSFQYPCLDTRIDDPGDIVFTTGTTGKPKGVVLTQRNLAAAARNINEFIGNDSQDRELVPLPLSHSFGLGRLKCNMLMGGMVILSEGFLLPGRLFDALDFWGATGFSFVPAGFSLLAKLTGDKLGDYANQLKYIEIGSAPMPLEHKQHLMSLLPKTRICMHYGLTEASRASFIEMHESKHKLDSVGKSSPNVQIRIIDDDGGNLQEEEIGQILIRGEMVMQKYWGNSDLTAETLKHGWLHTGDVGYTDQSGYLYLTGRDSDTINIGGLKVSPIEIEDILKSLDGIEDCACVRIPDPQGLSGEAIKAVLVSGDSDPTMRPTETQMVKHLRTKTEPYKIPKVFEWVNSIPKTQTGKILRRLLI